MRVVLYGNGSAGNHGCEAIVRGTAAMLGETHACTVMADNVEEDLRYGLGTLARILPAKEERKKGLEFLSAYAKLKLFGNYTDMDGLAYLPGIKRLKGAADIALSVGGDNYCYDGTRLYAYLNRAYRSQGIKTVLWGCSVEPDVVRQPSVAADLASYSLVVARESITLEAVKAVQPNTVLAPDPAFFMHSQVCDLDKRMERGNVIGINISPMIMSNENRQGMAYENYRCLIEHILKHTDAYIALIPHVVWAHNDDRAVLRRLYEQFDQDPRLILVEDHTAPELKYIISKCAFLIGARTHATIAAYSTCVPTLVVGYSVKARGIAQDLFGTWEGYVLPVQQLTTPEQLREAFRELYAQREEIQKHLERILPVYLRCDERVELLFGEK